MQIKINHIIKTLIIGGVLGLFTLSCSKDYFDDTGKAPEIFRGNMLEYLESKPLYYDTLREVIHLAGMDDIFENDSITFFAPVDYSIVESMTTLNNYLRTNGKDTITRLDQVSGETWKEMLSLYTFRGKYHQKDFTQIDTMAMLAYPGQNYESFEGRPMNIGVIFHDVNSVKYAGYRQILLSYITDFSKPQYKNKHVLVSSADINPDNGVVHALLFPEHYFGFDTTQFILSAVGNGIIEE